MHFLTLFQHLIISLFIYEAQGLVTSRGFRFTTPKNGQEGGCTPEDIEIIRHELKIVKEAAETAARDVTNYPFFYAFQKPNNAFFKDKQFTKAAREFFLRMARIADESYRGDNFRIHCRIEDCRYMGRGTHAILTESVMRQFVPPVLWLMKPSDPVLAFCEPFFTGVSGVPTQQRLEQFRQDLKELKEGKVKNLQSTSVNMDKVADTRSKVIMHELSHINYVAKPIIDIVRPNALRKKAMADYVYDVFECYQLANGWWKSGNGWTGDMENGVKGVKRAAMNAENWALVGMGTWFSKQLGIKKISIPGARDNHWGQEAET
ncbi:hypothetical protein CH63R_13471 [Colletotrichum higginsianum IMI 349063]|uniref:Lysine-specific metallo-endopeptidase domain-containing protein n=3 Tax=Colletotrichum higginsianum TaxID=80884 RepID=A0A1B7XR52_COLHI|nr:hypothetical protein CH63R_13471 [Colletotrichum higginsianum IMI 349063]OBR02245.1 hypothetical protein CH63R_13471 [Colletotrichum higginsianum IMI 349063]